ncbi:MAG: hypothetical protein Q9Q40_10945 [Acidobacteriota bacterium]|nr:hypothetical protein [Acidobacteriota bacterium]MDQ7087744.1 hypothetical protein [Acidobacteriota bacterium]
MAALLREKLGVEVEVVQGAPGEFSVWLGTRLVARRGPLRWPWTPVLPHLVARAARRR